MTVIVTGGTGFIGKHLVKALRDRGDEVVAVSSKDIFPTDVRQVDQIWHLASWTQAGPFCREHPAEVWLENQAINLRALYWWSKHYPEAKFISFGTSCAYGIGVPRSEDNYLRGTPHPDVYEYAMTKRMLQIGVEALGRQFGGKWLTIVPSTVYGPGYHRDGRQNHFIFDLVRKLAAPGPTELWGDGKQVRELIHVNTLIRLALDLAESEHGIWNVQGESATIARFARVLCSILEVPYKGKVYYNKSKSVGPRVKTLDQHKLNRFMDKKYEERRFYPFPKFYIKLETGLKELVLEEICPDARRTD